MTHSPRPTLLSRWTSQPWLWSFCGALGVYGLVLIFARGHGAWNVLTTAIAFSAFTVLVSTGQMFVITLGPGNIDLSLPATIGFASAVAMKVMNGSDSRIVLGLAAALGAGLAIGTVNYLLIRLLRIPPLIATLSASFVIRSIGISYGRGLQIVPPPGFSYLTTARIGGISLLALLVLAFSAIAALLLQRTVYGRSMLAVGQNMRAARLAGIPVGRVGWLTYTLCGGLAGLCGAFLAGFTGGSSLDVGADYLLTSIAVVVIGGTSVAGGMANVPGLWGGALMLFMTSTLLNASGLGVGARDLLTGLIIIAVMTLAGGKRQTTHGYGSQQIVR
jgi:ribose transport system permease protein